MGRRVGRLPDTVVRPGHHRLIDDCHGCNRALVTRQRLLRFREGFPHVQLVVHGPIIQVGSRIPSSPFGNVTAAGARSRIATAMTQKRIAILTGGGDVPGLNSVIKSVVYRATERWATRPSASAAGGRA